tara:strand:- start:671 stop:850 length:180 start_codon:yes stop_codon:yes gene_type:complete
MKKYIDIIGMLVNGLAKIWPKSCKSKCCSGSECECGNTKKNLIEEETEEVVENASVSSV